MRWREAAHLGIVRRQARRPRCDARVRSMPACWATCLRSSREILGEFAPAQPPVGIEQVDGALGDDDVGNHEGQAPEHLGDAYGQHAPMRAQSLLIEIERTTALHGLE